MNPKARRSGPPTGGPAPELIDSGFALENDDAPFLHEGFNLADMAHVLDLLRRQIIPTDAARRILALLLEVHELSAEEFPYDPAFGEPYNSRERYFVQRLGTVAGWLHAGRPRREAARIALRLFLRAQLLELVEEGSRFVAACADQSAAHLTTLVPDQTYLQQAQPSTFGHYLLSFAHPAARDAERLLEGYDWVNRSPGGAGCVNGTRLLEDRSHIARALGFDGVIEHTRDAMWQVDGLIHILATAASLASTQSKLAEDLEIWSSSEFDFVDLDDGYTRSSILMPQKRNPYSLSIVRGASGILIGRLSGFLAVAKSPSARSDNLIFAYGEVPRALDLSIRVTRLMVGVVATLTVNAERMRESLDAGYTQATDLTEYITQYCGVDYRTAYTVVGNTVREASRRGIPGHGITGQMLDETARAEVGHGWGLAELDLSEVLDPMSIVTTRTAMGGAAPQAVAEMVDHCRNTSSDLAARVEVRRTAVTEATESLLAQARAVAASASASAPEEEP
ncbi:argininosuccinate lyase [Leekyejoonella antrihumi]|uniref:Argininosuccinate lyase n=1 Tax=Leekyejoonella antrihumi TaxID=1660198 RepID=A0A563E675_9MICO|nr:argininosuccinate lyase [Leekyejoonella antrihumi]TWP38040.1 argininosuccinate lyase [Leekyejoonella antrihumi]